MCKGVHQACLLEQLNLRGVYCKDEKIAKFCEVIEASECAGEHWLAPECVAGIFMGWMESVTFIKGSENVSELLSLDQVVIFHLLSGAIVFFLLLKLLLLFLI